MEPEILNILKILLPSFASFLIGIAITPFVAHYLYKYKMWKKSGKRVALGGGGTEVLQSIGKDSDFGTPRMGGVIIWGSVLITTGLFWFFSLFMDGAFFEKMNFLSNNQTWIPIATLFAGAMVGLIDDILQVYGSGTYITGGLTLKIRILLVLLLGAMIAFWFYVKLEHSSILIPFFGEFELGILFVPFFMLVMLSLFSGGVIDGIDGLAGGIMASIFGAYSGIAFFQNQIDIAALSAVFAGAILAFLWFNIPPARFYMGESGMMALTSTLAVIAFLTKAVIPLLIIAFPLYLAVASDIIQITSKKLRNGKKIFLVAPIHHHFEALGWPPYKVTMRFWVVSVIFVIIGLIIAVIG